MLQHTFHIDGAESQGISEDLCGCPEAAYERQRDTKRRY